MLWNHSFSWFFQKAGDLSFRLLQDGAMVTSYDISSTLNKEFIAWQLRDKLSSFQQPSSGSGGGGSTSVRDRSSGNRNGGLRR